MTHKTIWSDVTDTGNVEHILRVYRAQQLVLAGGWTVVSRGVIWRYLVAQGVKP